MRTCGDGDKDGKIHHTERILDEMEDERDETRMERTHIGPEDLPTGLTRGRIFSQQQ